MDKRLVKKFLPLLLCLSLSHLVYADEADNIQGTWLTAEGKSKVDIFKCGEKYCGKIIWLKEPQYPADDAQGMGGQDKIDRENTDPSNKKRPLIGINIIQNFVYDGESEWTDGTIYDPRNGKTYKCIMTLTDANTVEVRGYVGLPLFGRTAVWTRIVDATRSMPSDATPAAATPSEAAPMGESAPE